MLSYRNGQLGFYSQSSASAFAGFGLNKLGTNVGSASVTATFNVINDFTTWTLGGGSTIYAAQELASAKMAQGLNAALPEVNALIQTGKILGGVGTALGVIGGVATLGIAGYEITHHDASGRSLADLHTVINVGVAGIGLAATAATVLVGATLISSPVLLGIGVAYLIYEKAGGEKFVDEHWGKNGSAWNLTPTMPPSGVVGY